MPSNRSLYVEARKSKRSEQQNERRMSVDELLKAAVLKGNIFKGDDSAVGGLVTCAVHRGFICSYV